MGREAGGRLVEARGLVTRRAAGFVMFGLLLLPLVWGPVSSSAAAQTPTSGVAQETFRSSVEAVNLSVSVRDNQIGRAHV